MPASQKVQLHQLGIFAEVEPVDTESRLFFTDEKPSFELTIHNEMDGDIGPESEVRWGIGIGEGRPAPHIEESLSIEVPAKSSRSYEIGGELLALEGHGVIGVKGGSVRGPQSDERTLSSQDLRDHYDVPFSFSVWDRENYKIQHERPVKYQKFSVAFAIVVAVLALAQIILQLV